MKHSIQPMSRPIRRRLKRVVQTSRDKDHARRAQALLLLAQGHHVSQTAHLVCAARSTVHYWKHLYQEDGEAGLEPAPRGRREWTVTEPLVQCLTQLVRSDPRAHGYLRSRWSSELLAEVLGRTERLRIHPSTVRRLLPRLGFGWRRARPTLYKRDPHKNRKLRAIYTATAKPRAGVAVFYVDEADIALNPRMGSAWMARGEQHAIPTPGQNEKRYLAGALHAHTGKLVWVEGERKNSLLFIRLLFTLKRTYRAARRLLIILDNYRIHKSQLVRQWLASNPKFKLLFQPAYHPWVNAIERLWKALHDTVTRNHRYQTLSALMQAVHRFMEVVQPFPGNAHALATL